MKQKEHIKTRKCFGFPKCFEIDSQVNRRYINSLKGAFMAEKIECTQEIIHGRKNRSWQKKSSIADSRKHSWQTQKIEHRRLKKSSIADSRKYRSWQKIEQIHKIDADSRKHSWQIDADSRNHSENRNIP